MSVRLANRARARNRPAGTALAVTVLCCALAGRAHSADEAADPSAANPGPNAPGLFAPTLGRPVFVAPGDVFQIVARIPRVRGTVTFDLVHTGPPEQRYPLECEQGVLERLAAGRPVRLSVPRAVPRRTYDLEIHSNGRRLLGRHCVAVGSVSRMLRLVHLANMNLGAIGAPHFDQRLIDEINLVAPTLIIATGDFLDATHADPLAGWHELVDQLTRFDAPLVMACGDHDDIELYSRHVAPSPIDLIDVGRHRCVVLLDHPLAPIHNNSEQLGWVEHALARPGFDGLTLVVTHDDSPNLLRYWRQQGTLEPMIRAGRIGLWFSGGHRDWDGHAYRDLVDAAAPMLYLRTHQSSTAPRDGATGISHYRIVDIADDRVVLPQAAPQCSGTPSSTPVGYLQAALEGRNDGSQTQLAFSVVNNLPYRLNGLALWLRLRKLEGHTPWCHGARLEQVIDLGDIWECRVRFDLPDKGSLRAAVGSGPEPAAPVATVRFAGASKLRFREQVTPEGVAFLSLTNDSPVVQVRNNGDEVVTVSPLVRLDGGPVAYRPLEGDGRYATAYCLRLQPGETISLQLDLAAVRVAPGRRELQVYLKGGGAVVPFCHAVDIVVDG